MGMLGGAGFGVAIGSDGTVGAGVPGMVIGGRVSGGGTEPGWPKPYSATKAAVTNRPPPSVIQILRPNIAPPLSSAHR